MANKETKPATRSGLMALLRRMRPTKAATPPAMQQPWSGAGCKVLALHISAATPRRLL